MCVCVCVCSVPRQDGSRGRCVALRTPRYAGPKGGLDQRQLYAWLVACEQPPADDGDDLKDTFDQINREGGQSARGAGGP